MPVIKFEDRTLRGLKVPEGKAREEWADTVVPGLRFRKSASGHGSFSVVYRIKGRDQQERRTIGPWPRVSLAQARQEANEDLIAAGRGQDPRLLRTAPVGEPTVRELWELYLEQHAKRRQVSWRNRERLVRKDVLPLIGDMLASEVRKRHLHQVIDRAVSKGAITTAQRLISDLSGIYTWAQGREIVENNPCHGFPVPKCAEPPQRKSLSDAELAALWHHLLLTAQSLERKKRGGAGSSQLLACAALTRLLLG